MAYRLRKSKTVQKSVKMVATEQIDKAIRELADEDLDHHKTVHQVRKRCKKLRGLIRLVRPCFADYHYENNYFRDAARELSRVRDAQAQVTTFDSLLGHFEAQLEQDAFSRCRQQLESRRQEIAHEEADLDRRLDEFLAKIQATRGRVSKWKIEDGGFAAVRDGLLKTYKRGKKALRRAYRKPSTEQFHEWRKRVKYHWYHARLLRRVWPSLMKVWGTTASELSDLLGDDHDLAVLRGTVLAKPEQYGSESELQLLMGLIDRRRAELQAQARPIGERLFAEDPKQLAARFDQYWKVWRIEPARPPKLEEESTAR